MKKILGVLSLFIALSLTVLGVLKIWGIEVFSLEDYKKTGLTLLVCFVSSVVIILLYSYFLKDHTKGYQIEDKKVAGKKITQ